MVPSAPSGAILDGKDEALVVGYVGDWDSLELEDIERAAGLKAWH